MEIKTVKIENPDELNMILGHTHFIKTVEDIYEAMVNAVPMAKFGLAFCEASQECLVRHDGTDEALIELGATCTKAIIDTLEGKVPENILNPEVLTRNQ